MKGAAPSLDTQRLGFATRRREDLFRIREMLDAAGPGTTGGWSILIASELKLIQRAREEYTIAAMPIGPEGVPHLCGFQKVRRFRSFMRQRLQRYYGRKDLHFIATPVLRKLLKHPKNLALEQLGLKGEVGLIRIDR